MNNHLKLVCFLCLIFLVPGLVSANDRKKLFLINSDASVEKYMTARESFLDSLNERNLNLISDIDLSNEKWKLADIENLINTEQPDLIYSIGTKAYLVASKYAPEKPIVFSSVLNWMRLPLTEKTCGVSSELHVGMQITLFRYIFPAIKKIGILYNKQYNGEWVLKSREAAEEMNIKIIDAAISESSETIPELERLLPQTDAFWLISDPVIMSEKNVLFGVLKQCDLSKHLVFSYHNAFAKYGAALIISPEDRTVGGQAADIAADLASGITPDEKVQMPAGSRIILNLKKVKEYGIEYNPNALDSVNQIIEN
jgi:putative ABC transport system substrate-binding protein